MVTLAGLIMIVVGIALYSITTLEPDVIILGDLYYVTVHPYENPARVFIIAGLLFSIGGVIVYAIKRTYPTT